MFRTLGIRNQVSSYAKFHGSVISYLHLLVELSVCVTTDRNSWWYTRRRSLCGQGNLHQAVKGFKVILGGYQ
jgi:hypothetical protein